MILSHEHKFIFLKTNKTAGTSIEIALSNMCGPDDVITPISAVDEETRTSQGARGPQNYKIDGSVRFYNHMTATELHAILPSDIWSNYFKFCVARNPWDRVISAYYHYYNDPKYEAESRPSLWDYISSGKTESLMERGFQSYTMNGSIAVDRILRFENLVEELKEVRNILKLPRPLQLPRAKGNFRKDRRHYSDVLSVDERKLIEDVFYPEICLMGWEF